MNKKIIIIIAVIVVIVVGAVIFALSRSAPAAPGGGSTGTLPPVSTTTAPVLGSVPTGTTITLGTPQGDVTMNNFYNNAVQISSDQQGVLMADSAAYNISYNRSDSSFSITLLQTPIASAKAAAEAAFLQETGINQQDACKLKVTVEVPVDVDPNSAGVNLGLSFCSSTTETNATGSNAFQSPSR